MKIRIFLFIALAAFVTLSFTVISVKNSDSKQEVPAKTTANNEPSGGFVSEDKF